MPMHCWWPFVYLALDLYHVNFPRDPVIFKCLGEAALCHPVCLRLSPSIAAVYGLLILDWVQTGLVTQNAFDTFVYYYGDRHEFDVMGNSWLSLIILSAVVSLVVQWFFAWRIYVVSRATVVAAVISLVRHRNPALSMVLRSPPFMFSLRVLWYRRPVE